MIEVSPPAQALQRAIRSNSEGNIEMCRIKWVMAFAASVVFVGTSVVEAKGPHRVWGKKSVDSHEFVVPEYVPTAPVAERAWEAPTASRVPGTRRPTLRQLATARRQLRAQQDAQREQLRQFQAVYGNLPIEDARGVVTGPSAIATTPAPQDRPRWFARTRRSDELAQPTRLDPQIVEPSNPIADRYEPRQRRAGSRAAQPVGPELSGPAPLFDASTPTDDHSVMTNRPIAQPASAADDDSPTLSERMQKWWSQR